MVINRKTTKQVYALQKPAKPALRLVVSSINRYYDAIQTNGHKLTVDQLEIDSGYFNLITGCTTKCGVYHGTSTDPMIISDLFDVLCHLSEASIYNTLSPLARSHVSRLSIIVLAKSCILPIGGKD